MGREWSSWDAAFAYYIAEGFEVGLARCDHCGHEQRSVQFPGTKVIECGECHWMASRIVYGYAEP